MFQKEGDERIVALAIEKADAVKGLLLVAGDGPDLDLATPDV